MKAAAQYGTDTAGNLSFKMHELSLAASIIESAVGAAKNNNASKVKKIYLDVGGLLMVNPEQLRFGLEVLSKDTIAEGMEVDIKKIPVKVKCASGHVSTLDPEINPLHNAPLLRCPECKAKVEVLGGRELILKKIIAE